MARRWDVHDFDDPDENPVTRLRHLGGDYGPYDPAHWEFDDDDEDFEGWNSDDSFSHIPKQVYDDFENEQAKHPRNPKDEVKRTPAGPIIILHDVDYFIPQWDEQLIGPEWRQKRGEWDYDNPPTPLLPNDPKMADAFKYCEECQLTWLVGFDKLKRHTHPHHFAWQPEAEYIDVHRWGLESEASIVVYVRGSCVLEGQTSQSPAGNPASLGIFFGKDSKYNVAGPQGNEPMSFDKEEAEVYAIVDALVKVRYQVIEDRRAILREVEKSTSGKPDKSLDDVGKKSHKSDGDSDDNDGEVYSEDDDDDIDLSTRIIIVSDNKKVIDNICNLEEKQPAKYSDAYDRLDDMLDELEEVDVHVKWYCVPEEFNKEAAELANEGLHGRFRGFEEGHKAKRTHP